MTPDRSTAILLLALLAGCNASNDRSAAAVTTAAAPVTASATARPEKNVALVMKTLTNPFFVEVEKGARRAEKELGFKLIVKAASQETSIEQQIQIVDDLIRDKVDAIVIAPGDSQRLVPVLKRAQAAHITVINIDNRLDPQAVKAEGMTPVPFVSVDNERASFQSAKFVADQIRKPAEVLVIEGIRSADNAQQRSAGTVRALAENKNVRIVSKVSANWKIDEGYAVTKQAFAAHPRIGAVFSGNDMMALGAIRYLADSGKHNVRVASYDAIDDAKAAVKAGTMTVTVDQQAAEQGFQGAVLAIKSLKGETVPQDTMVETRLITADTIK